MTTGVFPGYPNYTIFSDGRVMSHYYERFISCKGDKNGYLRVGLTNASGLKTFKVHRVILQTFRPVEGMEALEVNHINGNKTDNRVENLEWVTTLENIQHAIKTGLRSPPPSGLSSERGLFSRSDLEFIFREKRKGRTAREIASELSVKDFNVTQLLSGKRYIEDFRPFREVLIAEGVIPDRKYLKGVRIR